MRRTSQSCKSLFNLHAAGPGFPGAKVIASVCGAKAAKQTASDILNQRGEFAWVSGATMVCVRRLRRGQAAGGRSDRCYHLTPRGRLKETPR